MDNQQKPVDVVLQVGMHESYLSFGPEAKKLNTKTRASFFILAQNGLGIDRVEELGKNTIKVEYPSTSSQGNIVRAIGYAAQAGYGDMQPLHFVRPDGTEHDIQLS